jgi:serine/threonine protein kinase/tetratricopeptide (TPR) repeat protein
MIGCPPAVKWQQYLRERLSAMEERALTEHIEACQACEEMLAGLVAPCGKVGTAGESTPPPELLASLRRLWSSAFPLVDAASPECWPTIDGYEILGVLGRGGMGIVYRARQKDLGREVALKMLASGEWSSAAEVRRLLHDAEMAAQLRHEYIVPVYAVGQYRGLPFCVMELIAGGSLAQRVADLVTEPREAARLIAAAARALHYAHLHGICHRDVKPANILLRVRYPSPPAVAADPNGLFASPRPGLGDLDACVSDFGLARRTQDETGLTQTGAVVGTPGYMAPEQIRSEKPSPAADVYGLGAVLYECLTGQTPSRAATPFDTLLVTLHKDPERPRVLNSRLARDLETVCLKCLEKEPHRRYASAAALADDLERWLRGEPVRARRVGPLGRAWRWCRRNPVIATLLLAVTGGVFASLFLWRQALISLGNEQVALGKEQVARRESEEDNARLRDLLARSIHPQMTQVLVSQGMDPIHGDMLAEAEPCLSFLLQRRQQDSELRELLATVLTQLGAIRVMQDRDAEGQAFLERAAGLWEGWPAGEARTPENRAWLAIAHACLEQIHERQGRPDRAQESFASALGVWQALAKEPLNPRNGWVQVNAHLDIGWALITGGSSRKVSPRRFEEVRDRLSRATDTTQGDLFFDLARVGYWQREAEKPNPSRDPALILAESREAASLLKHRLLQAGLDGNTRSQAACIALQVCKTLRRAKASEEALGLSEQAQRTLAVLLQESPQQCGLLDALSQAWTEVAKVCWELDQAEETLIACRNALDAQLQVFALAPEIPASRTNLEWRYLQLGRKLCELGRLGEAEACFRERQVLLPNDAASRADVLKELRKWAAQVGKDKDNLSPAEQQERQRYLDLCSRLER